ncbi:hypothetical protein EDB89DRAFT_2068568 [Lactarius sanguifluus]|nr:hypothetical protein EDB89DRAFT_2068568 [Lactarius sanguifluus]
MTADQDPVTALRTHCVQALIVIMRRYGRWHCPKSEWSALLQWQLGVSSSVVERFLHGDSLQLAVAANLLSNALPRDVNELLTNESTREFDLFESSRDEYSRLRVLVRASTSSTFSEHEYSPSTRGTHSNAIGPTST